MGGRRGRVALSAGPWVPIDQRTKGRFHDDIVESYSHELSKLTFLPLWALPKRLPNERNAYRGIGPHLRLVGPWIYSAALRAGRVLKVIPVAEKFPNKISTALCAVDSMAPESGGAYGSIRSATAHSVFLSPSKS